MQGLPSGRSREIGFFTVYRLNPLCRLPPSPLVPCCFMAGIRGAGVSSREVVEVLAVTICPPF